MDVTPFFAIAASTFVLQASLVFSISLICLLAFSQSCRVLANSGRSRVFPAPADALAGFSVFLIVGFAFALGAMFKATWVPLEQEQKTKL